MITVETRMGTWIRDKGQWIGISTADQKFLDAVKLEALPKGIPGSTPNADWALCQAIAKYLKGSVDPAQAPVISQEGRIF